MKIVERHESPDRALTLLVSELDGDITIGFEGLPWHTHADLEAARTGRPRVLAVRELVDSILQDRQVIAVATINRQICAAWPTEALSPDPFQPADETLTFRRWSGAVASVARP
ncbi:hypothetical protein Pan44_04750 [Caulifigura coniformis]|uniref:Uncharacterized protein n=1 Tax=Caulifigura coniformis TaxID=2527983 RepID=A0A517S8M7_9PLAN|nr:hypothetical protein [Caulifigura coniformis]QDT52463.1 hypothetical protein Pan44_04750 [Caulifigura coniformis]